MRERERERERAEEEGTYRVENSANRFDIIP